MMRQIDSEPVPHERIIRIVYAFPAFVAICVLLARLCQPLLPHRPRWTKPFIEELNKHGEAHDQNHKMHYQPLTTALLVLVPIGLAIQVVTAVFRSVTYAAVLQLIALVSSSVGSEANFLTMTRQSLLCLRWLIALKLRQLVCSPSLPAIFRLRW